MNEQYPGWKDGKYNPDGEEIDYGFAFGQQLPQSWNKKDITPNPIPQISKADATKSLKRIALKMLWREINEKNTTISVDENGNIILK